MSTTKVTGNPIIDYSKKTRNELIEICKEMGLKGYSSKKKDELIQMILNPSINTTKKEKESIADTNISREDAEKSADEWLGSGESLMRTWLVSAIMDPKQHRDIGKVLAYVVEIHVNKWLSEKSSRPIKTVIGEPYDGITDDDKPKIRNQIKFRMSNWHFETTRRNSQKNAETNSTGHVAYKKDEFDMVIIFKPSSSFGISGATIRCIPVTALINPDKPDQLITNSSSSIRKIYDNDEKTDEVIKLLYLQTPPLPQD
jgi:hypothetical protein